MLPAEMKRNDVSVHMPLELCLCPAKDKNELSSVQYMRNYQRGFKEPAGSRLDSRVDFRIIWKDDWTPQAVA